MTSHVECPHCRVRYPLQRLYADHHDRPAPGKSYTIVCSVCADQFDVVFRRGWPWRGKTLRAVVKATGKGRDRP